MEAAVHPNDALATERARRTHEPHSDDGKVAVARLVADRVTVGSITCEVSERDWAEVAEIGASYPSVKAVADELVRVADELNDMRLDAAAWKRLAEDGKRGTGRPSAGDDLSAPVEGAEEEISPVPVEGLPARVKAELAELRYRASLLPGMREDLARTRGQASSAAARLAETERELASLREEVIGARQMRAAREEARDDGARKAALSRAEAAEAVLAAVGQALRCEGVPSAELPERAAKVHEERAKTIDLLAKAMDEVAVARGLGDGAPGARIARLERELDLAARALARAILWGDPERAGGERPRPRGRRRG